MKKPFKHLKNLLRFSRGATFPTTGPLKVEWEVINTCNAKCKTCLDWQGQPDSNILKTSQAKKLIDQLAAVGVLNLVFTGGEPLQRKDLPDLLHYAKSKNLTTELLTNGLLINERRANKIVDAQVDVVYVSIDAVSPELNDTLRGLPGYFKLAEAAIDNLKAMRRNGGPKIVVKAVVTSENVQQLVPLAEFVEAKGIDGFNFSIARILENRNFIFDDALLIGAAQQMQFCQQLDVLLKKHAKSLDGSKDYYKALQNIIRNPAAEHHYRPVSGYSFAQIDAWGNVFASSSKTDKIGNILERPFEEIWFGQTANELRKANLLKKEPNHIFDEAGRISVDFAQLNLRRLLKLMRPIFNGAKLF